MRGETATRRVGVTCQHPPSGAVSDLGLEPIFPESCALPTRLRGLSVTLGPHPIFLPPFSLRVPLSGIFKIEDSAQVARLWGIRKNRPAMNYDKLSRSIRQYYKKGIIRKPDISQRLVYQFVHPV